MNPQELINKYRGRQIDLDGYPPQQPFQCYDLGNQFSLDQGYGKFYGLYASDIFGQQPQNYTWVKNTPEGVVPPGSVVIWNRRKGGGAGHVAIGLGGDTNNFTSLDQNWNSNSVQIVKHDYSDVIGWGIPNNIKQGGSMTIGDGENWYARLNQLHVQLLGVEFPRKDFPWWVGKDTLTFIEAVSDNPIASQRGTVATLAMKDNWQGQIVTLLAQQKESKDQIDSLTKQVKELQAQVGVQSDDTKLLNGFGEFLTKMIVRLGLKKG